MWGWPLYLAQFAAYPLLVHRVLLPRIKPQSPGSAIPSLGSIYLLAPAALIFLLDPLFLVGASTNNFFSYFLLFEQLIAVLHTFELLYIDADQQKDYLSSFLRFAAFLYVPAKITLMSKNLGGDSLASTSSETMLDPSSEEARRLRKRQNIAQEILSTEQAYVNYLKTFDKWFMKRLTLRDSPILSKEDTKTIFSNLETIIGVNSKLLEELQARITNWSPEQKIGDVFLEFVPFLKTYTIYSNNYSNALQTYIRCRKENKAFAQFIKDTAKYPECTFHDANDYLIMPIQRVPRYILLLKDLVKNTDESHPDYEDLTKAVKLAEEVANYLNDRLKVAENMQKVADIQRGFGDDAPVLVAPSRRFVSEAKAKYLKKNQLKDVQLFLLNELLVCGKPKAKKDHKYKYLFQIDLLSIESVDDVSGQRPDMPNGFCVLTKSKESYTFSTATKDDKNWWIQSILDQKNNTQKVLSRPDRRSLRQPELERTLRRAKNPLTIRRKKEETVAGVKVEVAVEEEPLDLPSIQAKFKSLTSQGDFKELALYVANILKVILKSDDDKGGSVFIFPRELAIKRAIRGATKLALAALLRILHGLVVLTLSWTLNFGFLSMLWLENARYLLVHGAVHYLAFSALLDFVMAGFGWAIVREMEGGDAAASSTVYYNIAEAFYDPYFSASLADFWGRRYNAGLHDTLATFLRTWVPTVRLPAAADAVRRALTGLPLYLMVVGAINFVLFFIIEHRLTFSVILFFSIHASLVLAQALLHEADALPAAPSPASSSANDLLLFVGFQLKRARDVLFPTEVLRKYAGIVIFWLALYLTLPLYFADDHDYHKTSSGVSASSSTYFFNVWVAHTPTPTPSPSSSSWW